LNFESLFGITEKEAKNSLFFQFAKKERKKEEEIPTFSTKKKNGNNQPNFSSNFYNCILNEFDRLICLLDVN